MNNQKSVTISKSISISIKSNQRKSDLDGPLYAINWFDAKVGWLYKFYNMLAVGSVLKVGGKPFLKANTIRLIKGDPTFHKDVLLLVRYPSADSFLNLVSKKYFQLISLIRRAAVKDFTFGFATKLSKAKWEKKDEKYSYVLHHFQYDQFEFDPLLSLTESKQLKVLFMGTVNAHIYFKKDEKESQVPCLMDGAIIYSTENMRETESFLLSDAYQSLFTKGIKHSSIVEIDRVF